jgi:hypothetical protein
MRREIRPRMDIAHPVVPVFAWITSTTLATVAFWCLFGACVDQPMPRDEPQARVVASWDPLQCGDPHRVVVELEDDDGVPLSASAPCALGELTLDAPTFGRYRGRIYAWALGDPERSVAPVELIIDAPVLGWVVPTPR